MRISISTFVIGVALVRPAVALPICHRLLAIPINHQDLKGAAQAPQLATRLPDLLERQMKYRDSVGKLEPALAIAETAIANLEAVKPRWEHALDVVLPGLPLSRRAMRVVSLNQERRRLSRGHRADTWALEDLDREIEDLVFAELVTKNVNYELLISWRNAHASLVESAARVVRQIQDARAEVTRAQSDTWTESAGDISYLAKRTTMRIDPAIDRFLDAAIDFGLSAEAEAQRTAWRRFVESPAARRLDAVAGRLNEVEVVIRSLEEVAQRRQILLDSRAKMITELVSAYVELAAKSVKPPSAAP